MSIYRWCAGIVVVALIGGSCATSQQAPAPTAEKRVLLFYDMEGASGVDSGDQFDLTRPDAFTEGRGHLTADVNAVIAGLFDGGATAVDAFNTHGSLSDTLVSRARLDARARIISRRGPRVGYDPDNVALTGRYAAALSIAAHDKPRSGGFSPHTIAVGTTPVVNGVGLTETDLLAYAVGTRGVPMIMASGDDVLGRSLAQSLPWIEYVSVKRSVAGRTTLEPVETARAALRAAATRAMMRLGDGTMRPLLAKSPIRAGLLPSYPAWLYPTIDALPGIERHGDTVTFVARDYREAFRGMRLLLDMASSSREGLAVDILVSTPAGRASFRAASDTVTTRWMAFERGEWTPPQE